MNDAKSAAAVRQSVDQSLRHLEVETRLLEGCREALSAVREALRSGHGERLLDAIQLQRESEVQLTSMTASRAHLTAQLAASLELPLRQATLGALQMRLDDPATQSRLQAARQRARQAASHVERLCRGNAALIAHRIDLIQRMLTALGSAAAPTYEPQGLAAAAPRSTMQRDC